MAKKKRVASESNVIPAELLGYFLGRRPGEIQAEHLEAIHAFARLYLICPHSIPIFDSFTLADRTAVAVEVGQRVLVSMSRAAPLGYGRVRLSYQRAAFRRAPCMGACTSPVSIEVTP